MVVEMSIMPIGAGTHMHELIAVVLEEIRASGLPYETHAMGTNIQGEWDEVAALAKRCMEALYARGVERVTLSLHASDRRDATPNTLRRRKEAVGR